MKHAANAILIMGIAYILLLALSGCAKKSEPVVVVVVSKSCWSVKEISCNE